MAALVNVRTVFTLENDYRHFVAALAHAERCEIDEAMFVHWLETTRPVGMARDVVLADQREVRADFVIRTSDGTGSLYAFWHFCDSYNPTDRRYFAQSARCMV